MSTVYLMHETFKMPCLLCVGQVTAGESLFTYPDGLTAANFSVPDHVPQFLDEINSTVREQAENVCGANLQCIFDFAQTGNEALAQNTKTIDEENENNEQISSEIDFTFASVM